MKNQKILVIGDFVGHFRSQMFVQKLLHNDLSLNSKLLVSFANPNSYKLISSDSKISKFLFNKIFSFLFFIEIFIKVFFTNKIYFMAMNHRQFPIVLMANFFFRKPIIADFYNSIYDSTKSKDGFEGGFLRRIPTLRFEWYYKYLDRLIIERPEKTIFGCELELRKIANLVNANINKCKFKIIPPASLNKKIANPLPSTRFRICWWGTYIPLHGVENIIKTAALLKKEKIDFSLDMFGTPKHNGYSFIKLSEDLELTNQLTFHTNKSFGNGSLEECLSSNCDLILGNFSSSERALRTVPTKIFDSFCMRQPVLTMDTEVLRDMVDVENELFITDIEPKIICEAIIKIINNPKERKRRANNGFKRYQNSFSENVIQEQFINLFKT